jgi:hypothetical protein
LVLWRLLVLSHSIEKPPLSSPIGTPHQQGASQETEWWRKDSAMLPIFVRFEVLI